MRPLSTALLLFVPFVLSAQEVCDNGVDDDANGLVDLNDPACRCSATIVPENVSSYIPNHSFEDRVLDAQGTPACPYTYSTPGASTFVCLHDWYQATGATSDYFHECGFSPASFPLPPPDGEGAIGFISITDYMEYVGSCIACTSPTNPVPHPLNAGTTYTLSMWTAGLSISSTDLQGEPYNLGVFYEGEFPLTLWGHPNAMPFPASGIMNCIGTQPGWVELGRVSYQPDNGWIHVSMTFTPAQTIKSIMVGAPCDLPATFTSITREVTVGGQTVQMPFFPYTLVDELVLTEAVDQVLTPVRSEGRVCLNNVVLTAQPPAGATDHQWYLDGVAIAGQTATTLNASALGLAGGVYTLASTFEGQCLMGNTSVWDPELPEPALSLEPTSGCAPLTVAFADLSGAGTSTVQWTFGDGGSSALAEGTHTYMAEGSYDVTLTIRTADGCVTDTTLVDAVTVTGVLDGAIDATPNPTDVEHTTVELSSAGSTGPIVSWWWDLDGVAPGTSTAPALTVEFPAVPGEYPVMLVVRTADGCVDTVRSAVVVTEVGTIEMPNVFTPNGDGRNDVFLPLDLSNAVGQLEIYNRWGQLVYSTTSVQQGWNGTDVPEGTYYYVVIPSDADVERRSGHITLTR